MAEHTVASYDEELERLTRTLLRMGGLVETQIEKACASITQRDSAVAETVIFGDQEIDEMEAEAERLVTRLLALRAPVAIDLRLVISSLKMSSDLERMGDLAANIAKRAVVLSQVAPIKTLWMVPDMSIRVQSMVKNVLDAYVEKDVVKAREVWLADEKVDEIYNSLFRELLTYMFEDPRSITAGAHLLFVAKNLERIADHATNMAENVAYMLTGHRDMGDRPKGDTTAHYAGEDARSADNGKAANG
ncbi:MAG: phosphate transport system regulatory protein PhoU [Rhodospirillaceae bacterium]|nr:phosphate transport system regulatory protein PhoU [Rhodospirillaceae bacterium]